MYVAKLTVNEKVNFFMSIRFIAIFFFCIGLGFYPYTLLSQTFQKIYHHPGWEWSGYISKCRDGKFIGCGVNAPTSDVVNEKINLFKLDANYNLEWSKLYTADSNNFARSVMETGDGGYIITGGSKTQSFGDHDFFLLKTDSIGETEWMKIYGSNQDETGDPILSTLDGGYLMAGRKRVDSIGIFFYIIKSDANGDTLWTNCMGEGSDDMNGILEVGSGYLFTGFSGTINPGFQSGILLKLGFNGDTLWSKNYRLDSDIPIPVNTINGFNDVKKTSDNGFILTGNYGSFGTSEVVLMKTDTNGNPLWVKKYDSPGPDAGITVEETEDGGIILQGFNYVNNKRSVFLIKTNKNGDLLWSKTYGGSYYMNARSLVKTPDKGFLIAVEYWPDNNSTEEYFFIKADSLGNAGSCEVNPGEFIMSVPSINFKSGGPKIRSDSIFIKDITAFTMAVPMIYNDSSVCANVGIPEIQLKNSEFDLYPNPASKEIFLKGNLPLPVDISFFDVTGRKIFSEKLKSIEQAIPVSELSNGIYIYEIRSNSGIFRGRLEVDKN